MDNHSQERREYFRIDDKAIYSIKKIPSTENLETVSTDNTAFLLSSAISGLDLEYQAVMSKLKRSAPDVSIYLEVVNKKINLISKYILEKDSKIEEQTPRDINLSASGIAFETTATYQENDKLEIKLILLPELSGVLCIGEIKHIEKNQTSSTVHIDFTEITEADQELIIKHNMTLQLEQARAKNHLYD